MKNTRVIKICELCGASYSVKAYRAAASRFCSKECWSHRNPPIARDCEYCGKTFNSRDKRSRFCSRSCSRKPLIGERATAWKGGKSLHRKRAQAAGDLAKWRNAVYTRDGYTCQRCGKRGDNMHAHHVKPVAEYPELITDIDNGKTLCIPCHEQEHGRKISTPARFPKHCEDCGAQTTGRSLYCRSCSISHYHARVGHASSKSTGSTPVIS